MFWHRILPVTATVLLIGITAPWCAEPEPQVAKATTIEVARKPETVALPAPTPPETPLPLGSLWAQGSKSLLVTKTPKVGDLLVIDIIQSSNTSTTAKHATQKDLQVQADAGSGILRGFTGMGTKASRSTNGTGNSAASTVITDHLTVSVVQITPNGNLIIEGNRSIKLEADTLLLKFRGEVRPDDVTTSNTIPSTLIANIQLDTKGLGPIAEKQRPGLVSKLLSFLW